MVGDLKMRTKVQPRYTKKVTMPWFDFLWLPGFSTPNTTTKPCTTYCISSIMSEKKGAYGTTATDTNFRRKWDKEEYAEKAKQKDVEERERMQENEERMKQGLSLLFP